MSDTTTGHYPVRSTSRPIVLGLDLSLRGPAAVVLPADWTPCDWNAIHSLRVEVPQDLRGVERITLIAQTLYDFAVTRHHATHAFVEQYAFSFAPNAITGVAELLGATKFLFWSRNQTLITPLVASSSRKLFFGPLPRMNRRAWKTYIERRLDDAGLWLPTDDERDALIVANHGRHVLALPCCASPAAGSCGSGRGR